MGSTNQQFYIIPNNFGHLLLLQYTAASWTGKKETKNQRRQHQDALHAEYC